MEKAETSAIKLAAYIRKSYIDNQKDIINREISPIKLQKSLYFLFAYWGVYVRSNRNNKDSVEVDYSSYRDYLFNEDIQAWTYGPVIPKVYKAQKEDCKELKNVEDNYLEDKIVLKEFIDGLLPQLFEIDDFGLVRISHEDDCWKKNYNPQDIKHNRVIDKEDIINEYITKAF